MRGRLLLACLALAFAASSALAANARNPYRNVDPRVDAGNDTGDAYVDDLNRSQLDRNQYGYGRAPAPYYPARPYYSAPGYYAPSPYHYAPPY
jgi:hypothetical protein